ncbi:iron uptake system protein EfeO [Actinomyces faecalis]|uniref:iron uptake system protein EfeO n=1 Tax=Actinomyces faecalis TaxID=2722820 RepID=UPI002E28EED3|nr:iron uptake system protein EfeO [Actinomyces faecalis]
MNTPVRPALRGTSRRTALTLPLLALAGFGLAGCVDNKPASSGPSAGATEVTVTITDDGLELSTTSFPSGVVTFTMTNNGTVANEFEILTENKLQIVSEQENIGPGTTASLTTALSEGTYYAACKPNMVGELKGVTELTITKGAAVEVSEDVAALEKQAVTNYTAYVRDQVGQLLEATTTFTEAYTGGDTEKAKELFPLARQHYERIEPTAESFGIETAGDLDEALDLRIQDLAADARVETTDPSVIAEWTGWHRIEADLWDGGEGSPFAFADAAARQAVADKLVEDTQKLYDLVYGKVEGPGGVFELTLTDVATGAAALLEEVALSKIVGEEETFSHTDLYDFKANVEGAEVAYGNVEEIVRKNDADLAAEITKRFAVVNDLIAAQEDGTTADGATTYVDYSTIAAVQLNAGEAPSDADYTEVQREFSDAVNALSESLSQVAGTVLH